MWFTIIVKCLSNTAVLRLFACINHFLFSEYIALLILTIYVYYSSDNLMPIIKLLCRFQRALSLYCKIIKTLNKILVNSNSSKGAYN